MGLVQVSNEAAIAVACDEVIASEASKVVEYHAGRDKLFGFFVGQVMKKMGGKANPKIVNRVLRERLAAG
jgi:aspartyl-tRNA(Asn)/glutamyl-tRNA(Gln) amidotransferase subunit B